MGRVLGEPEEDRAISLAAHWTAADRRLEQQSDLGPEGQRPGEVELAAPPSGRTPQAVHHDIDESAGFLGRTLAVGQNAPMCRLAIGEYGTHLGVIAHQLAAERARGAPSKDGGDPFAVQTAI